MRWRFVGAGIAGAVAVAAGALGAHALRGDPQAADWMDKAARYLGWHALALLALGAVPTRFEGPARLMIAGAGLFAATLILMALGLPRWLGMVTPIGGTAMIAGWAWLALQAARRPSDVG